MDDDMMDVTISGWWTALSLFTRSALLLTVGLIVGILVAVSGVKLSVERISPFEVGLLTGAARLITITGCVALITWLLAFGTRPMIQRIARNTAFSCLATLVILLPIRAMTKL